MFSPESSVVIHLFSKNDCSKVKYSCASELTKVKSLTRDFKRAEINQT